MSDNTRNLHGNEGVGKCTLNSEGVNILQEWIHVLLHDRVIHNLRWEAQTATFNEVTPNALNTLYMSDNTRNLHGNEGVGKCTLNLEGVNILQAWIHVLLQDRVIHNLRLEAQTATFYEVIANALNTLYMSDNTRNLHGNEGVGKCTLNVESVNILQAWIHVLLQDRVIHNFRSEAQTATFYEAIPNALNTLYIVRQQQKLAWRCRCR